MRTERTTRLKLAAVAVALVTLAGMPAAAARDETRASSTRVATIASLTTRDFRVAVVAKRLNGGSAPTAEVRVGIANRVAGGWRESGERRLDETYFWRTLTGPRAVCRLEVATAGARPSFRPRVTVELLLSPSLGCGRTYRVPLANP